MESLEDTKEVGEGRGRRHQWATLHHNCVVDVALTICI